MGSPKLFRLLTTCAVLVSLFSALLVAGNSSVHASGGSTSVSAGPASKVSPDLRKLIDSGHGNDRVHLIVRANSASQGLVGSLLELLGGTVKAVLSNLNIRIVECYANSADVVAADPGVAYVSLDAPVHTLGHVTETTGARQSRSWRNGLGLSDTLDGSGVTIAILDSGIDTNHKSFSSISGKIKFSKDFTDENRTDDRYGHGTHVAAIAAGAGAPTNGGYEGIAPGASLVSLRVLDSDGVGTVAGVLSALDWLISNKGTYNIRVVNMSLGTVAINSYKNDPICNAVRKLVDSGVLVVAAAGNNGKDVNGQKIYGA
ncbi:MAG TPA: S8 family serine peptidase, partial [Pyrinomonadaceae bacterium]|nr:S8 family serine peptidase [Pyrinomonadaceae bacterium]